MPSGSSAARPFLERFGKYLLLDTDDLAATDRFFQRRGSVTILVSRFIPIVRHLISIPAGMGSMKLVPVLRLHGHRRGPVERIPHLVRFRAEKQLGSGDALQPLDRHRRRGPARGAHRAVRRAPYPETSEPTDRLTGHVPFARQGSRHPKERMQERHRLGDGGLDRG